MAASLHEVAVEMIYANSNSLYTPTLVTRNQNNEILFFKRQIYVTAQRSQFQYVQRFFPIGCHDSRQYLPLRHRCRLPYHRVFCHLLLPRQTQTRILLDWNVTSEIGTTGETKAMKNPCHRIATTSEWLFRRSK